MDCPGDDHEVYDEQIVGPIREESADYVEKMNADGVNTAAQYREQLRRNHPSIPPNVPLIPAQHKED